MAIALIFLLGVANFAMHRAVMESGHEMVRTMTSGGSPFSPRIMMVIEFCLLLVSLLLVAYGHTGWGWAYAIYSLANGAAAWAILTRRI